MSLKPNKLHQFQKPLDWSFCLSDKVFILLHFLVAVGRAKCGRRETFYNLFIKPQSFRLLLFGSSGKESTCNVGDLGSIPELGRYPGERKGCLLQHSGLENSMDCTVHGVVKSQTQLSDSHFLSFSWPVSLSCNLYLFLSYFLFPLR